MIEIDWNAPTVAPKVGEYGIQRNGRSVGPFKRKGGGRLSVVCFSAPCGDFWMDDGSWTSIPNGRDIIAIVPAPDSVEPDATQERGVVVTPISYEIKAPATAEMGASDYRVYLEHDGVFRVCGSVREHGFSASKPAAVAIARAILRMAGESK
jgi:hypothetical protein